MIPYNFKVWGYEPKLMNASWVGERVAMVDLEGTLQSFVKYVYSSEEDKQREMNDKCWGPNSTFKYPKYGGNASIWRGVSYLLPQADNLKLNTELVEIDTDLKVLKFKSNQTMNYDYLINTIPLDLLLTKLVKPTPKINVADIFDRHGGPPKFSKTHVVGLGFSGEAPQDLKSKSWMYFPSLDRSPFYRTTVFSNYSPYNVPEPGRQWSMMLEVCESEHLPRVESEILETTLQGALNEKLITEDHVDSICSKYHFTSDYGYPTPYLQRDGFLSEVEPTLRNQLQIYTRGRFGGWRYEVANQDHSCMQGVEAVDNILFGCEEQTYFYADHVNSRRETTRRFDLYK